jgi:hypothetical protein
MGISRACASKWVNRWRRHGELGLLDRSSAPHHSPTATPAAVVAQSESWRREKKWSAQRIAHELADQGIRKGADRRSLPRPGQGLVRLSRHQPHSPSRHRQRRLLPLRRLPTSGRRGHAPPEDQAPLPSTQRQSRALSTHPRRRTPLRPRVHQRRRPISGHRRVEHPLQLPPTPQHVRRSTASGATPRRRHQRPALLQRRRRLRVVGELRRDEHFRTRYARRCSVRPPDLRRRGHPRRPPGCAGSGTLPDPVRCRGARRHHAMRRWRGHAPR